MKATAGILLVATLAAAVGASAAGVPMMTDYPGKWQDEFNADLAKAIAWSKIKGCGDLSYIRSQTDQTRYLVRCVGSGGKTAFYEASIVTYSVKPAR